jgi:hypothetical protein
MTKEYRSIKDIEYDIEVWSNFRDYMKKHKQDYETKVYQEAISEADTKLTFLNAALQQRRYNGGT